ncbi:MAG: transposase [Spirochaetia bacterium]
MNRENFIGIDPDSLGLQCALLQIDSGKIDYRFFNSTQEGLESFGSWVKKTKTVYIGIEGKNGYSRKLEQYLRKNNIQFYSFTAQNVRYEKNATVSQHKTNKYDALAVAHLVHTLYLRGTLDKYKGIYLPNDELRDLTRRFQSKSKKLTEAVNIFWKAIRNSSQVLYIHLTGNTENSLPRQFHIGKGFISLILAKPDINSWCKLSFKELKDIIGNGVRDKNVEILLEVSKKTQPMGSISQLLLQQAAEDVQRLSAQKSKLTQLLDTCFNDIPEIEMLKKIKGFGPILSTGIVAEVIDIRRFANNNNLASYSGLGRVLKMTGKNGREVPVKRYNKRLKDYFIKAAKSFIMYNPDSHLAAYYWYLRKKKMKPTEALKRVARALVRRLYRYLKEVKIKEIESAANETSAHSGYNPSNATFNLKNNDSTKNRKEVLVIT